MGKNKSLFLFLNNYYKGQKSKLFILLLVSLSIVSLQIVLPQIIRVFIDSITSNTLTKNISDYAIYFIIVSVVIGCLQILSKYISENIGWDSTNRIREDLYQHVMSLDEIFHQTNSPGELVEKIDGDVTNLQEFFSDFLVKFISNIFLLIGVLTILYLENVYIGISLTAFVLVAMFTINRIRSFAVPYWIKLRKLKTKFYGSITEIFEGLDVLRANSSQKFGLQLFNQKIKNWLPIRLKAQLASITLWMSILFIFTLGLLISFGVGTTLWYEGAITIGTMYMIYNYTELLRKPIEQIRVQVNILQTAEASLIRINEIFEQKPLSVDGNKHLDKNQDVTIDIKDVSFKYKEDESKNELLNKINLNIKPNEPVGIIGKTGSGKTTLAKLIMKIKEPDFGEIYFNNINSKEINAFSLRELVAYVPQNTKLFNGTIRENITLYKQMSDEEILDIFSKLDILDFYCSLPNGLSTQVGTKGGNLSAGERQLIALCRIYIRDSKVIILDEISTYMDEHTQSQVQHALEFFFKNKTVFIIAHKLETLEKVSNIYLLEKATLKKVNKNLLLKDYYSNALKIHN
jgi:ATP-binding cassette, subfamily B, bacterial